MAIKKEGKVKIEPAAAHELKSLIDYSAGAVVSRELIRNDAGTITLFAFDEGEGISEHTSPYDAVVQILDGAGVLIIGGKEVKAKAGELVIMPRQVPHGLMAEKRFKMLLTLVRG